MRNGEKMDFSAEDPAKIKRVSLIFYLVWVTTPSRVGKPPKQAGNARFFLCVLPGQVIVQVTKCHKCVQFGVPW
jgi:hypothetical protein